MIDVHLGENLEILRGLPGSSFNLIYIDPPYNTGKPQRLRRLKAVRDDQGERVGFGGNRYRTVPQDAHSFTDRFDDYPAFLEPRLREARRLLTPEGAFFLQVDYREVHYCKVLLDRIFGRSSFLNEIIWAYDFGGRATRRWPAKHDNILWYAVDPRRYTFRREDMDRIPYLAPGLVGPAKAARGKTPTDTWWQTIVGTSGRERTGYPTQKPLALAERIVRVHSKPGDRLLDFFAGSGTLGEAAAHLGRDAVLIDVNPEAISVMKRRFSSLDHVRYHGCDLIEPAAQRSRSAAIPEPGPR